MASTAVCFSEPALFETIPFCPGAQRDRTWDHIAPYGVILKLVNLGALQDGLPAHACETQAEMR